MPVPSVSSDIVSVSASTNDEFIERCAGLGRIGLVAGVTWIDKTIRRAERHVYAKNQWGRWSHAFIFGEKRIDGFQWIIESDLQLRRKHYRLGVQENRITKYSDGSAYPSMAILDFKLDSRATGALLREALDCVANHVRYSIRELVGTLIALRHPGLRSGANVLERDHCYYCSAFVQQIYRRIGIELIPGVSDKHGTPDELFHSPIPHTIYLLDRPMPESRWERMDAKVRQLKDRRKRSRVSR